MANNKRISETTALRLAEQIVARSMPSGWSAKVVQAPGRSVGPRSVSFRIRTSGGDASDFGIVTKRSLNPRDAGQLLDAMSVEATTSLRGPKSVDLAVIAPYLSERTREVIASRGVSYLDSTGNMRLRSDKPALYILTNGADKDPWPDDQPLKSLRGRGAGRALRAVVDFRPPYGVRELAGRANVSPATLARVIDLLARDALLIRDARGRVNDVDWDGCLRRWSNDYEFATSNRTTCSSRHVGSATSPRSSPPSSGVSRSPVHSPPSPTPPSRRHSSACSTSMTLRPQCGTSISAR